MGRTIKAVDGRLDSFGSFLGMEKGCIVLRDKHGNSIVFTGGKHRKDSADEKKHRGYSFYE